MPHRPRTPSTRAQVITALQEYTQRQLAEILGVSERSIRRWKNEGVQPLNPFVRHALEDEFRKERRRIRRSMRKIRAEPPEKRTGIPLLGERRWLREYNQRGVWTGRHTISDVVNYNVTGLDARDVFEVLRELRDRGATIQLIYRVKAYPEGNRKWAPGYHGGTNFYPLRGYSDSDIWELVVKYIVAGSHHRIIYVGVIEK